MSKTFKKKYRHQTIQYWIKKAGLQALKQMKEQVTNKNGGCGDGRAVYVR
jgi:hypothetical protein